MISKALHASVQKSIEAKIHREITWRYRKNQWFVFSYTNPRHTSPDAIQLSVDFSDGGRKVGIKPRVPPYSITKLYCFPGGFCV